MACIIFFSRGICRGQVGAVRAPLIAPPQHPGDRLMYPRIYLQVTGALGCEPQLYTTVGTYVSSLCVPSCVLHRNSEQPLA
jgi:hypothetical protein